MATVDYSFLSFLLKQIDKRNYHYIDSLSEEQLKQVQPFTLLRWFSCVQNGSGVSEYQLLTAYQINKKLSSSDKKFLLKQLCSAGMQRELRHQWIAPIIKKKEEKKSKKWEKIKELLNLNDIETDIFFKKFNSKQIDDLLHLFGLQDNEIKCL